MSPPPPPGSFEGTTVLNQAYRKSRDIGIDDMELGDTSVVLFDYVGELSGIDAVVEPAGGSLTFHYGISVGRKGQGRGRRDLGDDRKQQEEETRTPYDRPHLRRRYFRRIWSPLTRNKTHIIYKISRLSLAPRKSRLKNRKPRPSSVSMFFRYP